MPPYPPPKLWNVLAYVALISVGFGYVVFVSGPTPYESVWAWVIWLVMINVANVALNWQAWSQPMRLPTRTELRSLKPLSFIEILNALVVILWVGVGISFLYGLPKEARLDHLMSNKPMWAFFWAAMVVVPVRAHVVRSSSARKAEPGVGADSR